MEIRELEEQDWPQVWAIIEQVVRAGDTFTYDPAMTEAQARSTWHGHVVVSVEGPTVLGTASMYANRPGPGSHIASGSFMVDQSTRGRGVGRALVLYQLDWARTQGFQGVQFNAVAASNVGAVHLYEDLGFTIIGTVPGAFLHPAEGPVGLHVMFHGLGS